MKARLIGKGFATKVCRKNESIMYIGIGDKNEVRIKLINTLHPPGQYCDTPLKIMNFQTYSIFFSLISEDHKMLTVVSLIKIFRENMQS